MKHLLFHQKSKWDVKQAPWSTERVARLVVGLLVMIGFACGYCISELCYFFLLPLGFNLFLSSLIGHCYFHQLLLKCGFKDREDLYFPGGIRKHIEGEK